MSGTALPELRLVPVDGADDVKLGTRTARLSDAPSKAELKAATDTLLERLTELQEAFYADGRHALLLVLQGRDASGKDGVIRTVTGAPSRMKRKGARRSRTMWSSLPV